MNTNTNTLPLLASYTPGQIEFIKFLQTHRAALTVYDTCTVSRKDLVELLSKSPYIAVPAWIAAAKTRRAGRGNYLIPELAADVATLVVNGNKRGRKPGSPNQKGRIGAPTTPPSTVTPPSAPALATTTA
jgi:hypothetical protein